MQSGRDGSRGRVGVVMIKVASFCWYGTDARQESLVLEAGAMTDFFDVADEGLADVQDHEFQSTRFGG